MYNLFYEVVFYVCLSASPQQCHEHPMTWSVALPAPMCAAKALPEARLWELTHPGWFVKRATCRPPLSVKHV